MATDRFSELSGSLINDILSRLPMKEVVATMLLSKRWKDVWTTVPCLQFHSESDGKDDLLKFRGFFSRVLELWKGEKIVSLSFRYHIEVEDPHLDSSLEIAVQKQVEELCVDSTGGPYECPDCVYSCSSLKKLTLSVVTFNVYETVKWNRLKWSRLKSLTLRRPEPYLEEEMDRIFKGAPLLEALNLTLIENESDFAIRSEGLKAIKIDYIQYDSQIYAAGLTIDAPNLESLEISGIWHTICSMNVPSLKTAILGFDIRDNMLPGEDSPNEAAEPEEVFTLVFRSISHVQNLTLNEWSFELLVDQLEDEEFSVELLNVKSLNLCTREAEWIPLALSIFPALETLVIDHKEFDNVLVEPKKNFPCPPLPQLRRVEISWDVRDAWMIGVVESLVKDGRVLDKLVLRVRNGDGASQGLVVSATERVMEMLQPSYNASVVYQ